MSTVAQAAKIRQQAADLISRIAVVMKACDEEKLLGHLGVVLYEYLGEEYPEVLGSILAALKVPPCPGRGTRSSSSGCTTHACDLVQCMHVLVWAFLQPACRAGRDWRGWVGGCVFGEGGGGGIMRQASSAEDWCTVY